MTTTAKAASNGGATTGKPASAQREHGIDRLREEECYYLTGLIKECLGEAEHLIRKVHNKAFNRTIDHDGTKGTAPLDRAEARQVLGEARECVAVALDYLYRATNDLRDEPAF